MGERGGEKSRTFCVNLYVVCSYGLTHSINNLSASGWQGIHTAHRTGGKMLTQHPHLSWVPMETEINQDWYRKRIAALFHLITPGTELPKHLISILHDQNHLPTHSFQQPEKLGAVRAWCGTLRVSSAPGVFVLLVARDSTLMEPWAMFAQLCWNALQAGPESKLKFGVTGMGLQGDKGAGGPGKAPVSAAKGVSVLPAGEH